MKRAARILALTLGGLGVLLAAAFLFNGTASRSAAPQVGRTGRGTPSVDSRRLTVMAFNIAKCGFHRGGLSFREPDEVEATLTAIAELIRAEQVDVAFLSEVVGEAGPCPVDQVRFLSEASGLPHHAFGENYSFGLPWYRIRAGNAVLSKLPLRGVGLQRLPGPDGILDPTNVRRALWVELQVDGQWLLAASVRNDSFDLVNNADQVAALLHEIGERPALLAGDFNAEPDSPPLRLLRDTGRFLVPSDRTPTYPTSSPTRRIDDVHAPASWSLLEQRVVHTTVSDHLPVVAVYDVRME
ncbi:MAG: endonuclease/exonuclease/phosphatase family protein [Planctomycetota bacterium]